MKNLATLCYHASAKITRGSQVLARASSTNKHDKKPIMLFKAAQIWHSLGHTRLPINARTNLTTGLLTRYFLTVSCCANHRLKNYQVFAAA